MAERTWDLCLSLDYGVKILTQIRAVEAVLHSELRRGYKKPACFYWGSREISCEILGDDLKISSDLGTCSQIALKEGAL